MVSLSTTQLPQLEAIDVIDRLVGLSDPKAALTPKARQRIAEGKIAASGAGASVNVEQVINLAPDLVTTVGVGDPQYDAHPKLLETGIKVTLTADYMEDGALAHAEWVKYLALFVNREAAATRWFDEAATKYETLAGRAKNVSNKPTVMITHDVVRDTWYVPGGRHWFAMLVQDAGANYLWAGQQVTGNIPLRFEQVFDVGSHADVWLLTSGPFQARDQMLAFHPRYSEFDAVKNVRAYNNNLKLDGSGANHYWQTGVSNPHVILADVIKILHPQLVPEHQLTYFRHLR